MTAALTIDRPRSGVCGAIDRALSLARQLGQSSLLTRTERLSFAPDPLAFLAASSSVLGTGAMWEQPGAGPAFAGAGSALEIRASGTGRFGMVSGAMRDLGHRLVRDNDDACFPIVGGFAFSERTEDPGSWIDFPDTLLVVPRVLVQRNGDTALLRVTMQVDPGSSHDRIEQEMAALFARSRPWTYAALPVSRDPVDIRMQSLPGRRAWESSVATAIALIRQGMLGKVVLAREERLRSPIPFSPFSTLARLRWLESDATLFAMQSRGAWFIGATPERLVRLRDGRVDVTCLAGSIGAGLDDGERQRLADRLVASAKDREEHEIVVRSTMSALAEVCEDVTRTPATPRVVAARSVQHLATPLSAQMSNAGNVLDLVERLHPTPAVGGYPQANALLIIRELEEIDRGWYAGPFGWTDLDGSGEFAVAIRSALLSGRVASVFAGCGIVADSVPAAEYEESRLKMRPMLSALGAA